METKDNPKKPVQIVFRVPKQQEDNERRSNKIVALATLIGTLVLVGVLAYCFRRPKEVVVQAPAPEPVVVVKREVVTVPAPPPPAPVPILQPVKPEPKPEPLPPPAPVPGPYDGVWRVFNRASPLPAFRLKETEEGFIGSYFPANKNGPFEFKAGKIENNRLQLAVHDDHSGQTVHFEILFQSESAQVWGWRTADNVLAEMEKIKHRRDLTPTQRKVMMATAQADLRKAGKRISFGTFRHAGGREE